ncbi:MAG: hypothetical protein S4CHLAM6_07270 [Chlamydiae bacterium]|nr:hypothetical protein [Chlamydiota bacterium]
MSAKKINVFILVCLIVFLAARSHLDANTNQSEKAVSKEPNNKYLNRDCLTINDQYLEGYLQSKLDQEYPSYPVRVIVRHRYAYLYSLPKDDQIRSGMITVASKTPGILGVKVKEGIEPAKPGKVACLVPAKKPRIKGIWFPQNTVLFPPLIARPRAVLNSISYRWQWKEASEMLGKNAVAVSFGDIFPLYRFIDLGKAHAKLQFSLEAASWALFRIDHNEANDWSEFVNADYMLGVPITMAVGNWSGRLTLYHVSTHLGDEFLINNPNLLRVNPSYEGVELFVAYLFRDNIKPYLGIGRIFRTDSTFPFKPLYFEYGGEFRFLRRVVHYNRLYGQAFVAAHFKNDETRHWALDSTVVAGYEWSKLQGAGRRFRIFMEWHNGFAPDGQFYKERLDYFGFRISYGF